MKYLSTRSSTHSSRLKSFRDILLEGLAPDGGLFVPHTYPVFSESELAALRPLSYVDLAYAIIRRYADDIPEDDLKAILARTYTPAVFGSPDITPVRKLEAGLYLLGCSNGPTLAFKDIAMQWLGHLFEYVLAKREGGLNILGATSGDTGSSAEYAMRGKQGVRVFMLSPDGKMSPFQAAQMFSLQDANIHNIAVRGVFDDCQDIVKAVSNDLAFKARYHIGAVNSINWGRIVAQVVYYFKAYFAVTASNAEKVSFAVPSGNFGNVLAGHIAHMMGLPVRRLIVATNENDVLDEFFKSGRYRPRKTAETRQTSSPSMDISKASNFERFLYDLVWRDPAVVRELMRRVDQEGGFDLSHCEYWQRLPAFGMVSGRSSHTDRLATIRQVWDRYQQEIDPHTADGLKVGLEYRELGVPLVCLETALPAKFAATMEEALGRPPARPAAFAGIETLPQRVEVMDVDVAQIKARIAAVCEAGSKP
ncbi:MAG: threonine synthase [Betaproteobacteria bacterium]|nr:threonine synthase [Betaproteobacteria bacterium]